MAISAGKKTYMSPPVSRPSANKSKKVRTPVLTNHIKLTDFGEDENGNLYIETKIKVGISWRRHLLQLTKVKKASVDLDSFNVNGAKLFSPASQKELFQRIRRHNGQGDRFNVITRIGWFRDTFYLPDWNYGPGMTNYRLHLGSPYDDHNARFAVDGSLQSWQQLPLLAINNTRLVLLLSMAFSGPLVSLLQLATIDVAIVGDHMSGKTTAIVAAGSVWGLNDDYMLGDKYGFAQPFEKSRDFLSRELFLAGDTLVLTPSAKGRKLYSNYFDLHARNLWTPLPESTSEESLLSTQPQTARGAPTVLTANLTEWRQLEKVLRESFIAIPLPAASHGIFENIGIDEEVSDFCEQIRYITKRNYGHPSREYITALVDSNLKNPVRLRAWVETRRSEYLRYTKNIVAAGLDLGDVHAKMATVYASACFAIKHQILPWTEQIVMDSLIACTRGHVEFAARENLERNQGDISVTANS